MSHFFLSFHGEIIKIECAIFVVAIKDLEMRFNNTNLLLGKSAICFELLTQKREIGKQTANMLY